MNIPFTPPTYHNASPSTLYQHALLYEEHTFISSTGALLCLSGQKTGRCPKDKRIVKEDTSKNNIWWGKINIQTTITNYNINKNKAINYLQTAKRLYISDIVAGKDKYKIKFRIITTRAYHALFMQNMFETTTFDKPDFYILNAGQYDDTAINISFEDKSMVILGTMYAGEMKKGIFSILHYVYPLEYNILTLHSSANEGVDNDVSIFFGLSGTGKTTLSTDPFRKLIGDDELAWYDDGVFNIESGCYAKVINLDKASEPFIYDAIKFGSVVENVVYDKHTGVVDYRDKSITENTRCAYPMTFIPHAKLSGMGPHPKNIILLTCDAFGVLPAVAKLNTNQLMYYFLTGYTAILAGTISGVTEPKPEFSSCFGDAFLTLSPTIYASLLASKLEKHLATAWLVNTGWMGGKAGVGKRMSIKDTRAIIDAIHDESLCKLPVQNFDIFNLSVPVGHPLISNEILDPISTWEDKKEYKETLINLAGLFIDNFKQYESFVNVNVIGAGPVLKN